MSRAQLQLQLYFSFGGGTNTSLYSQVGLYHMEKRAGFCSVSRPGFEPWLYHVGGGLPPSITN